MALNKREQNIAIAVGVVVGLAAIFFVVNNLFIGKISDYNGRIGTAQKEIKDDKLLLTSINDTNTKWNNLGIQKEQASISEQVFNELVNIAGRTGIPLSAVTMQQQGSIPKAVAKTDYSEVNYKIVIKCNTATLAKFLYALETAKEPIKLDQLTIITPKAGEDTLQADLTLVALMYTRKNTVVGRGGPATRTASSVTSKIPTESTTQEATIEEIMMRRREQQMKDSNAPATAPAAKPLTPEEAEAEMMKKRQEQTGATSMPAAMPMGASTTSPAITPGGVR